GRARCRGRCRSRSSSLPAQTPRSSCSGYSVYLKIDTVSGDHEVQGERHALPADLVAWIEDIAGGRVTRVDRQPGGARKEAWFVDTQGATGEVDELFLRYDRTDPAKTGDPWTLHREATVYLALQDCEVP